MADVFVSYSKDCRQPTVELASELKAAGLTVWWDDASLLSGEVYSHTIARELNEARVVIVIWSPSAVTSDWVYSEADRARKARKLVQVTLAGLDHSLLPPPFDALHVVSFEDRPAILRSFVRLGVIPSSPSTQLLDTKVVAGINQRTAPQAEVARVSQDAQQVLGVPTLFGVIQRLVGSTWSFRFFIPTLLQKEIEMRISCAALLRISEGGSYLLIRNLHRKELLAPIGGVYKYYTSAQPKFDALEFRPQASAQPEDTVHDLRGFVPSRKVMAFRKWFEGGLDREDAQACLKRELGEELYEVGLNTGIALPSHIQFRLVRRVEEGPSLVPGQRYRQYRIFDVYEPIVSDTVISTFLRTLCQMSRTHKDLELVAADEIRAGRSRAGDPIGGHAGYLFGRKQLHPNAPMFIEQTPRER